MPELLLLLIAGVTISAPPLMSGLFARRMGRSFKKWFLIGCILPFISIIILFFLPDKSEPNL